MKKDIIKWVRSCEPCQKNKVARHTISPVKSLPKPTRRFEHIHVDLVGPINPPCEGKNMLFTIIDRWTGWPEAIPITQRGEAASARTCAKHLINGWIKQFGLPQTITSDRGRQFVSRIWAELNNILGIQHIQTSAYHPQHNGKVERMHRSLKDAIRSRLNGRKMWLNELPWALLGLRACPNGDTGISPAQMVMGQQPDLPGQIVMPKENISDPSDFAKELHKSLSSQPVVKNPWHGGEKRRAYIPEGLKSCKYVLLRVDATKPSLSLRYRGPYQVLRRDEKTFLIQLENSTEVVSIDRLKPFYE